MKLWLNYLQALSYNGEWNCEIKIIYIVSKQGNNELSKMQSESLLIAFALLHTCKHANIQFISADLNSGMKLFVCIDCGKVIVKSM